jgi:LPXTG-site transpeptidase (sortase) family protein
MLAAIVNSLSERERAIMRNQQHGQSGSRGAGVLRWAERLLVIAGAAMLVWCALFLIDGSLSQWAARQSLEAASRSATPISPPAAEKTSGVAVVAAPVRKVSRGSAIADLSIPRLQLSAVVLHGSDARTLRRGPGHIENTALPGESGNVAIAGHRDSFFRPLRDIHLADDIFMDTPRGRFHYRVTSMRVVNAHDLSVLAPTDDATLTLITCYPFWVLGHAPDRFVVRATRVVEQTAAAFATGPAPPRESIHSSFVQVPAAHKSVGLKALPVRSDETLVREAIERFRLTYNARLVRRNDVRPGGPLKPQTCDVIVDGDRAEATCGDSSQPPDDGEAAVWTATLQRTDGEWAIRSVFMN